jgi:hypothetical protein
MVEDPIRNLIAGGPTKWPSESWIGSDTILKMSIEPNSTLQNRLVKR